MVVLTKDRPVLGDCESDGCSDGGMLGRCGGTVLVVQYCDVEAGKKKARERGQSRRKGR